jgi:hypothetical protein
MRCSRVWREQFVRMLPLLPLSSPSLDCHFVYQPNEMCQPICQFSWNVFGSVSSQVVSLGQVVEVLLLPCSLWGTTPTTRAGALHLPEPARHLYQVGSKYPDTPPTLTAVKHVLRWLSNTTSKTFDYSIQGSQLHVHKTALPGAGVMYHLWGSGTMRDHSARL